MKIEISGLPKGEKLFKESIQYICEKSLSKFESSIKYFKLYVKSIHEGHGKKKFELNAQVDLLRGHFSVSIVDWDIYFAIKKLLKEVEGKLIKLKK